MPSLAQLADLVLLCVAGGDRSADIALARHHHGIVLAHEPVPVAHKLVVLLAGLLPIIEKRVPGPLAIGVLLHAEGGRPLLHQRVIVVDLLRLPLDQIALLVDLLP